MLKKSADPAKRKLTNVTCVSCGRKIDLNKPGVYHSSSMFFEKPGVVPCCHDCMERIYDELTEEYKNQKYINYELKAIKRICMTFDIYFSYKVADAAMKHVIKEPNFSLISSYLKTINLMQYRNKTYDDTIEELETENINDDNINGKKKSRFVTRKVIDFFGDGLSNEDYIFLQREYEDWTARCTCNTKQEEEIFKNICFKQLELSKARKTGADTKDLDVSFLKYLETANLQPKQKNSSVTESQSFGTLIDRWEEERPIPEPKEEFKDVDYIGKYLDVFFKGHLAKAHNLKNKNQKLYDDYMEKYTVHRQSSDLDEDSEAMFDKIFGSVSDDD